jgi:uracil-DNA glycosylase
MIMTCTTPALSLRGLGRLSSRLMPNPAQQLLVRYLMESAARGETHVKLTDEARARLGLRGPNRGRATKSTAEHSLAVAKISKEEQLAQIRQQAAQCARCSSLGSLRETMVFATGTADAAVMFIGEAPGAEEEKLAEPFVGPAGQLLTKIIQAMGLTRGAVYISNICKYRPKIDGGPQGSANRPPTPEEMAACLPYINEEIAIVSPKVIVALGSTAAMGLGIEGTVGRLRGSFREYQKIPVMVTYHPSFLLRREKEDGGGIAEKRLVWEDILKVMELTGLPISEKQRGYFTKASR